MTLGNMREGLVPVSTLRCRWLAYVHRSLAQALTSSENNNENLYRFFLCGGGAPFLLQIMRGRGQFANRTSDKLTIGCKI
jgi:hypothetical protein